LSIPEAGVNLDGAVDAREKAAIEVAKNDVYVAKLRNTVKVVRNIGRGGRVCQYSHAEEGSGWMNFSNTSLVK
jgi:hypothetical protein